MSEYNSRMYGQMNNHLSYGRDDGYPNMRAQDFSGYDKRFYRQHSTYEQEHSPDFSGGQGVPEDIRKWAIGDWLDETVNTLAEEKAIAMAKRRARNSAPQPVYSEDEIRQKRRAERQREIFMRNREKYGYGNGGENYRRTYQYVRKNDPRFEEDLPRDDRFNQEYQDDGYGLDRKLGYGSYRPRKYGLRTNPYFKKQEEETYPHEVYQRPNYEQAPSRRYERPQPRRTYDKKPRDIRRYKPKPYSKEQSSSMPKSGYMQLGAYSNKNIAKHDWVKLVQNHASLRDYKPVIVPQDSKRGVLYKLIVKGNSQDLQGVCSNLKSKAQDCMVR
jgi:hypothetical protein